MLADLPFRSWEKRLALAIRSPSLRVLLKELLREWRYQVLSERSPGDLLIVEDGIDIPAADGPVLHLGGGSPGPGRLPMPLPVESLWIALEELFHTPARKHIRIPLHTAVTVNRRGIEREQILLSLSDRGASLEYDAEPQRDEVLTVTLRSGKEPHILEGKVIYAISRSGAGAEVGVLFDTLPEMERERLRGTIVGSYLERVRERMDEEVFREGMTFLRLPGEHGQGEGVTP